MRVLVTGDRRWSDEETIRLRLQALKEEHGLNLFVISGGATGADTICAKLCEELGIDQAIFPANWNGRGRAAGPVRNAVMAGMRPDLCVAFHRYLPGSKGTKHMVDLCEQRGVAVEVIAPATRARIPA